MNNLSFIRYALSAFVNSCGIAVYADRDNNERFIVRAENIVSGHVIAESEFTSKAAVDDFISDLNDMPLVAAFDCAVYCLKESSAAGDAPLSESERKAANEVIACARITSPFLKKEAMNFIAKNINDGLEMPAINELRGALGLLSINSLGQLAADPLEAIFNKSLKNS